MQIVALVTEGFTNAQIGHRIGVSRFTVIDHLRGIYDKVGVWNRLELALWYLAQHS